MAGTTGLSGAYLTLTVQLAGNPDSVDWQIRDITLFFIAPLTNVRDLVLGHRWRGSPREDLGHLSVWRNGVNVLPLQLLVSLDQRGNSPMRRLASFGVKTCKYSHDIALQATAYNDTVQPYLKFGVYRGSWKGTPAAPLRSTQSAIAYGALKVGNERMS